MDRNQTIYAAYQEGETYRAIASRQGISAERVRQVCWREAKRRNEPRRPHDLNRYRSPDRALFRKDLLEQYERGTSVADLASQYALTEQGIRRNLWRAARENGVALVPPRCKETMERHQAVLDAFHKGMSGADIARTMGYAESSVYSILHQHGIWIYKPCYHVDLSEKEIVK
jgi:transposase-like protein